VYKRQVDDFSTELDSRGEEHRLILDPGIPLESGTTYLFELILTSDQGQITLQGDTLANEGEWDDAVPYRVEGYDPFGGIYPPDVNFNMYWEETPEKLERFLTILDRSDFIAITSSRQWGSLPRIPERFPLSTIYYRALLGCPPEEEIEWCYNVAEPGMFSSDLGFELVKTFQSNPGIGYLEVNDQFAEEAFTVYDHPKVFIFQKTPEYNPEKVREILGAVDFSSIIRKPPLQYESHPEDLTLPTARLTEQRQGGTWSELYNSESPINRQPILGVLIWYLSLTALGVTVYPLIRLALPGLADKGYPLARIIGLLLLSYLVWLAGSMRIPFSKTTILLVWGGLLLCAASVTYIYRFDMIAELRSKWRYFLTIEVLVLVFFIIDLLIRYGNPDLWHPWKGGEKPMDFAYLNAVLKSTSFPPYDPWYAGGYLNYYYYGFMLVGVLVKLLGIVPAFAYNLIIPTVFSLIAIGAFSIAWNLTVASRTRSDSDPALASQQATNRYLPYITGFAGAVGMAILGNLGTVKMIVLGFQRLAAPGGIYDSAGFLNRLAWTLPGFFRAVVGESLPYGIGDWYWNPSRIIPAPNEFEPITEFPFFTVLYGDPHAHLFALPIALLALAFTLSIVLSKARWRNLPASVLGIALGAMVIGALRPTNTWDFYTYLALGIVALGYAILSGSSASSPIWRKYQLLSGLPNVWRKALTFLGGILVFAGLAFVLYQPYADWYALGYTDIDIWQGTRTPLHAYFLHWGLFLFVILSWMIWETIDWMANTPVSALNKLKPHRELIWIGLVLLGLLTIALGINIPGLDNLPIGKGVNVAWIVLPMGAWAAILLFRPHISEAKKFVLFLIGTGLLLTLMVELIALRVDIFRMNTVFKFYLQVWTLFAVSAAAALGWVLVALPQWSNRWRNLWQVGVIFLITGAALYPLMASRAKIEDRMAPEAPASLDGMEFMKYATYLDEWGAMDLSQDYGAIRWLQENVEGSPVILEANLRNLYRWGSRMTNYTGLPGVVGWEWHQQQQRAVLAGALITERIYEIDDFYMTNNIDWAVEFLQKYDVRYIILGQQERGHYSGPGLAKFEEYEGILWREVYRDGNTVIYEVIGN
jgi:YYY domain-containing protein